MRNIEVRQHAASILRPLFSDVGHVTSAHDALPKAINTVVLTLVRPNIEKRHTGRSGRKEMGRREGDKFVSYQCEFVTSVSSALDSDPNRAPCESYSSNEYV